MTSLAELVSSYENPTSAADVELPAVPFPVGAAASLEKPTGNPHELPNTPKQHTASVDFPLDNPLDSRDGCVKRAERHFGRSTMNSMLELKHKTEVSAIAIQRESNKRKYIRWGTTFCALACSGVTFILSSMPFCDDSKSLIPRRAEVVEADNACKDNLLYAVIALSAICGIMDGIINLTSIRSHATRLRDVSSAFKKLAGELRASLFNAHPDEPPAKTLQRFLDKYGTIDTAYEEAGLPQPSTASIAKVKKEIAERERVEPTAVIV
jgi:hypothetical protein